MFKYWFHRVAVVVLSCAVAVAGMIAVAAPAEAKIVAKKICKQVDPNLKSGNCIQSNAGNSVTWLGNYQSSNGNKFFCIDYLFADTTNPIPPGTSMQNMKNKNGKTVPNGALRVLGWVLERHAPNGGAGNATQNSAIQLLVREVMNDSGGFYAGPGGDFLRPGNAVQPINGGSGWKTPGAILNQAQAYWNEGSTYYAKANGTYSVNVSLPATVETGVAAQGVVNATGLTGAGVPGLGVALSVTGASGSPLSGKTDANGNFVFTVVASAGATTVGVTAQITGPTYANYYQPSGWPGNGKQRALFSSTAVSAGSGTANVPVVPKEGTARARKVSSVTGDPLEGAVLRMKDGATILGEWTTDVDGLTPAVTVTVGHNICIYEISPPPGYDPVDPNVPLACQTLSTPDTLMTIEAENTPTPLLIPTVVTTASEQQVVPGTPISDEIVVGNTGGATIPASWTVFGPVPPNKSDADPCLHLDFSGAAIAATGSFTVVGDNTYVEGSFTPTVLGCYGYSVTLDETGTTEGVTHGPDQEDETTLVKNPLVTPVVTTQASNNQVDEGAVIWDDVAVAGTAGDPIDATITLFGPMPPDVVTPATPCDPIDWSAAPVATTEDFVVDGDGTYRVGEFGLDDLPGCYSYAVDLAESWSTNPVTFPAGDPAETVIVLDQPLTPIIRTDAQPDLVVAAGTDIFDRVEVDNTGGTTIQAHWQLFGPLDPEISDDHPCDDLDWSTAPVLASGDFTVTGDGFYDTPPTTVSAAGCYSFEEQLDATIFTDAVDQPAGDFRETVMVKPDTAPPTITTAIDTASLGADGTITDLVTVTGVDGHDFTLEWALYGPMAPGSGSDCSIAAVDWGSAPVVDSGTQSHIGDGTYTVGPVGPLALEQCYSFAMDVPQTWEVNAASTDPGVPSETILRPTPITPDLATTTSRKKAKIGQTIRDTLVISNVPSGPVIDGVWKMRGPAPLKKKGRVAVRKLSPKKTVAKSRKICKKYAKWNKAKVRARGTFQVSGPGTYRHGAYKLERAGCYAWQQTLKASWGTVKLNDPAGDDASEMTWVKPGKGSKGSRARTLGISAPLMLGAP